MALTHCDISSCFNALFEQKYRVQLVGGASEPVYIPPSEVRPMGVLRYREDFAASALHESAHWCIAGAARRKQIDFGYAYIAPPRSAVTQQQFYAYELKSQALERVFCESAGVKFRISSDNLDGNFNEIGEQNFAARVERCATSMKLQLQKQPNSRPALFVAALAAHTVHHIKTRLDCD